MAQLAGESEESAEVDEETAALAKNLAAYRGVWVFVEQSDGEAAKVSWELLGKGRELADLVGVPLSAVVIGENVKHLRRDAFSCGAGGGRMWMEEHHGRRINLNRVGEALAARPDTVCVSCPYCMTMFEDGLKDLQAASVKVVDIAEIVAERLV